MTLQEFLQEFDFGYHLVENEEHKIVIKLDDMQGANLGGIEDEEFSCIDGVIERLDIYYQDYIFRDIDDLYPDNKCETTNDYLKFAKKHERLKGHLKLINIIMGNTKLEKEL